MFIVLNIWTTPEYNVGLFLAFYIGTACLNATQVFCMLYCHSDFKKGSFGPWREYSANHCLPYMCRSWVFIPNIWWSSVYSHLPLNLLSTGKDIPESPVNRANQHIIVRSKHIVVMADWPSVANILLCLLRTVCKVSKKKVPLCLHCFLLYKCVNDSIYHSLWDLLHLVK